MKSLRMHAHDLLEPIVHVDVVVESYDDGEVDIVLKELGGYDVVVSLSKEQTTLLHRLLTEIVGSE